MNEKILEYFKSDDIHLVQCEHKWCDAYGYEKSQMKKDLIDYIINLQQDLDKANDIIEKDRQFYKCRMDEYVELKKENEILRKNAEHNDKVVDKARWNEMIYKSRCNKALEYMKLIEMDKTDKYIPIRDYNEYKKLLNILNGDDEK